MQYAVEEGGGGAGPGGRVVGGSVGCEGGSVVGGSVGCEGGSVVGGSVCFGTGKCPYGKQSNIRSEPSALVFTVHFNSDTLLLLNTSKDG